MRIAKATLTSYYPSDERIQILQESCKMIQNLQDSCKNLARYQLRQKINRGTNVLGKIIKTNYCLSNKLQNLIQ